ncbi:MAG: PhoU domain-containing protein [Spirochaetota bacterium]
MLFAPANLPDAPNSNLLTMRGELERTEQELFDYTRQVMEFLRYNNAVREKLRKRSRRSIERNADTDVRGELIFIDIIRHLEHIGDNCLNMSEAVGELA